MKLRSLHFLALGASLCALPACGGGSTTGASVDFVVPRGGVMPPFFALPFPTDLRVRADGTLDLAGFPEGKRPDAIRGFLQIFEKETRGAATSGAVFFHFSTAIDPATLPTTASSTTALATAFLVDVDPASPARGARHPLQVRYWKDASIYVPAQTVALLPFPGIPLRPKTKYAAVVTSRVKTSGGAALGPSAEFAKVRSKTAAADAPVEAVRAAYAPTLDALEAMGVARADIAGMTLFTTSDPAADLRRMRAYLHASVPAPTVSSILCSRDTLYIKCEGEYSQPSYRAGVAPYMSEGGQLVFDAAGNPVEQSRETMKFTMTLPKDAPPASGNGFPVVLVSHGTGGSRNSLLGPNDVGDVMARRGIAAIGIDQPLQGARDTYCPEDPERRDTCQDFWTFNPSNFVAARDNFRQGVIDNFNLVRLVKGIRLTAEEAIHEVPVKLDENKLLFFGHSQGGIVGPPFVALEPELKGAVISGGGGILGYGLLLKTSPTDIKGAIEFLLGIEGSNELELAHPLITLTQGFIEPADPVNYAEAMAVAPPAGAACRDVLITQGLGDSYTPNQATEALATAAGVNPALPVLSPVEGLALRGKSALMAPITNNVAGPSGGKSCTAVLAQYPRATDADTNSSHDGHFVVYWSATARRQYADFLQSIALNGSGTLPAP